MIRVALRLPAWALVVVLVMTTSARAQLGALLDTFGDPAAGPKGRFGHSLAALGNNILVGAPRDNTLGPETGAAYLLDPTGKLLATFHSPAPGDGDWFGHAVAAVGDRVVISALRNDSGGRDVGAAYVFDTAGTLLATLESPSPTGFDAFGQSLVAVGDDKVLVGADRWRDPGGAFDSGIAYLFDTQGALLHTFQNPTPGSGDHFGRSLAAVGDRIVIGAMGDDTAALGAGAAYVFDHSGALLQTLHSPTAAAGDNFGAVVAGSGVSEILVGANLADIAGKDAGAVFRYDFNGQLVGAYGNPTGRSSENFGLSIAALEDHVVVGAAALLAGVSRVGGAYLFSPSGALVHTFVNPSPSSYDSFGASLGVVGNSLLIGAPLEDAFARDAGAVYLVQGLREPQLIGDADLDGRVDTDDFQTLRQNFGQRGTRRQGDFNGDGLISLLDLGSIKANFGATRQTPGAAAVPEPSSLLLACLAAGLMYFVGRRASAR
jgi:hypothetical protein